MVARPRAQSAQRLRAGGILMASTRRLSRVRRVPRVVAAGREAGDGTAGSGGGPVGFSGGSPGSSKRALPAAAVTLAGIDGLRVFLIRTVADGERLPGSAAVAAAAAGIAALPRARRTFSTVGRVLA